MKNKVTTYLTKVSNNQIKGVVDRKEQANNEALLGKSMKELKKIYWYEKELLVVIPLLLSNAHTFELVDSLCVLNKYTRDHIKLLEDNFPNINKLEIPINPYPLLPRKKIV
jgi:hypothetical protein